MTRNGRRSIGRAFGLLTLSVLSVAASCGAPRPTSLVAGTLRIDRVAVVTHATSPSGVQALPGDWILRSAKLRVVVGGLTRRIGERGAILEAESAETTEDESIGVLVPSVHVGARRFAVDVTDFEVISRQDRPRLRMTGAVHLPGASTLRFTRELTLARTSAAVGITTTVAPEEGSTDVRLGARIGWGGAEPWLPGLGKLHDDDWHDASFLGVEGRNTGTVYALRQGAVRIGAEYERHGAERFLRHTEVMGPAQRASAAHPASESAMLVVTPRGMAEALRRLGWLRGAAFEEAPIWLPYAPPGAVVRVATSAGSPLVDVRPDARGSAMVPLPPILDHVAEDYVAIATASGHAQSDPVTFAPHRHVRLEIPRGGRVRVTARDADTQARLPARVRFLAAQGTPPLDLGPDWSADGAGDTVVMPDGDAIVPVAPGRYRVVVTHGPEWTLHEELVDVTETFRPDVAARLAHVVDPGPWVACDLHVHASPSPDSHVSLGDRIASLVAEGIAFAVPTDHNHVTDYAPTARTLGFADDVFHTISGVEVTTWEPHFGHFNAYPVPLDENQPNNGAPPWEGLMPADLFASLRALGTDVVVQVNHPRLDGEIGYFDQVGYDPTTGASTGPYSANYDVLEVWNGFDLNRQAALERILHEWLAMVARGRHVTAVGNSDSHLIRFQNAGYPRTYVRCPSRDPIAIVRAIRAGRAFVTSGPFLEADVGGIWPGEVAPVQGGVAHVHVLVRTPAWMTVEHLEIWIDGAKVHEQAILPPAAPSPPPPPVRHGHRAPEAPPPPAPSTVVRLDTTVDVEVHGDTGIVVIVRGDHPLDTFFGRELVSPLAFTNPIWIDADGDGRGPADPGDPAPSPGRWDAVVHAADAGPPADGGGEQ